MADEYDDLYDIANLDDGELKDLVLQELRAVLDGLLEHLLNGVAYCRMEYTDGQPSDFLFLYTNPAFHTQTGLADVRGKHVSEVVPTLPQTDPALLDIFGRVARGGQPETFVMPVKSMAETPAATSSPSRGWPGSRWRRCSTPLRPRSRCSTSPTIRRGSSTRRSTPPSRAGGGARRGRSSRSGSRTGGRGSRPAPSSTGSRRTW